MGTAWHHRLGFATTTAEHLPTPQKSSKTAEFRRRAARRRTAADGSRGRSHWMWCGPTGFGGGSSRCDAAATTWTVRGDGSRRRRRGDDADSPPELKTAAFSQVLLRRRHDAPVPRAAAALRGRVGTAGRLGRRVRVLSPRGYTADESPRRRRGRGRGYPVETESRRRRGRGRGFSAETSRGDAAAGTWIFHRGDKSRRRHGCGDVNLRKRSVSGIRRVAGGPPYGAARRTAPRRRRGAGARTRAGGRAASIEAARPADPPRATAGRARTRVRSSTTSSSTST